MGQAASRQRAPQQPTHAQDRPRSTPTPEASTSRNEQATTEAATVTNKRSRRASLRRSILGLIPSSSSSSSTRSRKDSSSSGSESSQSPRKRWRSSRRFSKAPASLSDLAETSQQPGAQHADREPASAEGSVSDISSGRLPQSQINGPSTSSTAPLPSTSRIAVAEQDRTPKQSSSSTVRLDSAAQVSTIVPTEPANPAPTHPTTEEIRREVAEFLNGHAEEPVAPSSGDSEIAANEGSREPQPTNGDTNNSPQTSPQHFPPPGTLVVVQGVVNTTDTPHASPAHNAVASSHAIPPTAPSRSSSVFPSSPTTLPVRRRANSASTPTSIPRMLGPEDAPQPRSRLSSFIRPGRAPSEGGSHAHSASVPDADLSSSRQNLHSSPSTSSTDSTTPPTTPPETPSSPPSDSPTNRGLSPGSIDVLGTLLSVAAAATAASLFSPGVSQSNSQSNTATPPSPQATVRPLSPTPTAGLGAIGGLNSFSGHGINPPSTTGAAPQDGRDRIRNVWESIRERVGLNSRNSISAERPSTEAPIASTIPSPTPTAPSPPTDRDRMRPSEMMLAEMARALNAGLGLANATGGNATNSTETRQSTVGAPNGAQVLFPPIMDGAGTLPPEGSFERFLANLQQDLRTILSEEPSATPDSTADEVPSSETDVLELELPGDVDHSHDEHTTSLNEDLPTHETDSEESDSDFQDADEDLPDDAPAEEATPTNPVRTATPIPSTSGIPTTPNQPSTPELTQRRRERPAINLWRLYRFDPIPANHAQERAAHTNPATTPSGNSDNATIRLQGVSSVASDASSSSPESDGQPQSTPPAGTTPNVVVPVIVVGLQSVDITDQEEPEDEPNPAQHAHAGPSTLLSDSASQDGTPPAGGPSTPRGRTWPSRAANALRTWRPGRRGSGARRNAEGTGSRTFLIYVIGGYYPPNHHMVTGSDNLDSYEALWELAELLGQVKPPTATHEEIDNSGLQIIKGSDLSRYEEDGRVASNCVDRCLVCLDDYEPEHDVRVMSCRHAFHKECVDKWLTVGRNNCPACRTKGVNVSGDPPPPSDPTIV